MINFRLSGELNPCKTHRCNERTRDEILPNHLSNSLSCPNNYLSEVLHQFAHIWGDELMMSPSETTWCNLLQNHQIASLHGFKIISQSAGINAKLVSLLIHIFMLIFNSFVNDQCLQKHTKITTTLKSYFGSWSVSEVTRPSSDRQLCSRRGHCQTRVTGDTGLEVRRHAVVLLINPFSFWNFDYVLS